MKRVWVTAVCALACALVGSAAAQEDGEVEIFVPGGGQATGSAGVQIIRGSALSDVSPAATASPRILRIAPAADAAADTAKAAGDGSGLLGGAETAAPAAAAEAAPEVDAALAGGVEPAETVASPAPAAAVATPVAGAAMRAAGGARARSDDINGIVLSALACSPAAPTMCDGGEAGLPGAALTGLAAGGSLDQQRVAALFREMMAPVWTAQQQRAIEMIGYYSAAAALCASEELDPEAVSRLVQANFTLASGATAAQIRYRRDALSLHIGMATGLAMGAHMESAAFCAEAQANRPGFAASLLRVREIEGPDLSGPAPALAPPPAPLAAR